MRTRFIAVAVAGVLAAACSDANTPTAVGLEQPLASLSDGNHSPGNSHFFFLPPIAKRDGPNGRFDDRLDPVVDICELNLAGLCAGPVAHFTTSSRHGHGESERVRRDGNHYEVNWHTRRFDLDPAKFYRICVSVGPNALGHADVDVLRNGRERRSVDRDQFVPLQNGSTLPIKFLIEQGALAPGAFVDQGCAGALRPAEIRGTKCLVTADHDEDDDDDEEDDQHPEPSPSLSGRGDGHDGDDHDGHDHDGRGEDDDHDRDNHQSRCKHDDDHAAGIADWPITLSGPVSLSTTTDANGNYSFTNLPPGTYTVCEPENVVEVFPNGFVEVFPSAGADCGNGRFGYLLVLGSGQVAKHKDFGNAPLAGIHGTKVSDVNGNGARDLGEPGLSGWTIRLTGTDGMGNSVNRDATTGSDGSYAFIKLNPGSYTVCEVLQGGFTQTLPMSGPSCTDGGSSHGYLVMLSVGQNATGSDFGNQPQTATGEIHGTKSADDGSPLLDWPINLFDDKGNLIGTTTTQPIFDQFNNIVAAGYQFTGLPNGTYKVCEGIGAGFQGEVSPTATTGADCGTAQFVDPFTGNTVTVSMFGYVVTIANGEVKTGFDFVNKPPAL